MLVGEFAISLQIQVALVLRPDRKDVTDLRTDTDDLRLIDTVKSSLNDHLAREPKTHA